MDLHCFWQKLAGRSHVAPCARLATDAFNEPFTIRDFETQRHLQENILTVFGHILRQVVSDKRTRHLPCYILLPYPT